MQRPWRPRRRFRHLQAFHACNLQLPERSGTNPTLLYFSLWSLEAAPADVFLALCQCRGHDGVQPPGGPPLGEKEILAHARWIYTSEKVFAEPSPEWESIHDTDLWDGLSRNELHSPTSGQIRVCIEAVSCRPVSMDRREGKGAMGEGHNTPGGPAGKQQPQALGEGAPSSATAASRDECETEKEGTGAGMQEGEQGPSVASSLGLEQESEQGTGAPREAAPPPTVTTTLLDGMFDINELTYVGGEKPELSRLPRSTLLVQLDDGFYLFPPDENWKSLIRPPMVSYDEEKIRSMLVSRLGNDGGGGSQALAGSQSTPNLSTRSADVPVLAGMRGRKGDLSPFQIPRFLQGPAPNAAGLKSPPQAPVHMRQKSAPAELILHAIREMRTHRARLLETEARGEELRGILDGVLEKHNEAVKQQQQLRRAQAKAERQRKDAEACAAELAEVRSGNEALRAALPERRRELDLRICAVAADREALGEVEMMVEGPEIKGRLNQVHRALVARRCRMCHEVAEAYNLGPKAVPLATTSLGDLAARLDQSWWRHGLAGAPRAAAQQNTERRAAEPRSSAGSGSPGVDLTPGWGRESAIKREVARLEICGLEIEPNLGSRGIVGSMSWDDAEERRSSAALGYVASIVCLLADYLEVPLRYPLRPQGSRSVVLDHAPMRRRVPDQGQLGGQPKAAAFANHRARGSSTSLAGSSKGPASYSSQSEQSQQLQGAGSSTDPPWIPPSIFPLYYAGNERTRFAYAIFLLNKDIEQLLDIHALPSAGPSHLLQNLWTLIAAARSALPPPGKPPAEKPRRGGANVQPGSCPETLGSSSCDKQQAQQMTTAEVRAMFSEALFPDGSPRSKIPTAQHASDAVPGTSSEAGTSKRGGSGSIGTSSAGPSSLTSSFARLLLGRKGPSSAPQTGQIGGSSLGAGGVSKETSASEQNQPTEEGPMAVAARAAADADAHDAEVARLSRLATELEAQSNQPGGVEEALRAFDATREITEHEFGESLLTSERQVDVDVEENAGEAAARAAADTAVHNAEVDRLNRIAGELEAQTNLLPAPDETLEVPQGYDAAQGIDDGIGFAKVAIPVATGLPPFAAMERSLEADELMAMATDAARLEGDVENDIAGLLARAAALKKTRGADNSSANDSSSAEPTVDLKGGNGNAQSSGRSEIEQLIDSSKHELQIEEESQDDLSALLARAAALREPSKPVSAGGMEQQKPPPQRPLRLAQSPEGIEEEANDLLHQVLAGNGSSSAMPTAGFTEDDEVAALIGQVMAEVQSSKTDDAAEGPEVDNGDQEGGEGFGTSRSVSSIDSEVEDLLLDLPDVPADTLSTAPKPPRNS